MGGEGFAREMLLADVDDDEAAALLLWLDCSGPAEDILATTNAQRPPSRHAPRSPFVFVSIYHPDVPTHSETSPPSISHTKLCMIAATRTTAPNVLHWSAHHSTANPKIPKPSKRHTFLSFLHHAITTNGSQHGDQPIRVFQDARTSLLNLKHELSLSPLNSKHRANDRVLQRDTTLEQDDNNNNINNNNNISTDNEMLQPWRVRYLQSCHWSCLLTNANEMLQTRLSYRTKERKEGR